MKSPKRLLFVLLLLCAFAPSLHAQMFYTLYDGHIPNSTGNSQKENWTYNNGQPSVVSNVDVPTITPFPPAADKQTRAAVIIFPGGGYAVEVNDAEGVHIAEAFASHGISAFVVKYRLPNNVSMKDRSIGAIQDAQQAIRFVREHAQEWKIDSNKIGIMGFSAGGHLAAMAGTQFDTSYIPGTDKTSIRPDFMMLVYPVISMQDALTHMGSRTLLLGEHPTPAKIALFSNELHVTSHTPPVWLTQTEDDSTVTVKNSLVFYNALMAKRVPVEMHLFTKGGHGFVLHEPIEEWMQSIFLWMKKGGWLEK